MTGSLHTAHYRHAPALATVTLTPKTPIIVIVQRQHSITLAISPEDADADRRTPRNTARQISAEQARARAR